MSHFDLMVPCYNYGRYLCQSVESVLAQSHRDLRVVIIDDASSDNTAEVCASLAARDSRVEILRHRANIGHIATFNECIDLAERDYMLILSADDFLLPGALARAALVLDSRRDVGFAPGQPVLYNEGDPLPDTAGDSPEAMVVDSGRLMQQLARRNTINSATAVVRTSVQKRLGGYRSDLPHSADLELWLRFALRSKVAILGAKQSVYRLHDSNMSRTYERTTDLEQCIAAFLPHFEEIRRRLPNGVMIERRIRETLASRARALAASPAGRLGAAAAAASATQGEGASPSLAVIISCDKNPQNIGAIIDAARQALPAAAIILLDQAATDTLDQRDDVSWREVWLRRAVVGSGCGVVVLQATSLPFDHYLVIDDDMLLTPAQIAALVSRSLTESDRAHGVWGQRFEVADGAVRFQNSMTGIDGALSVLQRAYTFSRNQAAQAITLSRRLGFSDWHEVGPASDILLSCGSTKPPLCHNLGEIRSPPADGRPGAAESGAAVDEQRIAVIRKLIAMNAIRKHR